MNKIILLVFFLLSSFANSLKAEDKTPSTGFGLMAGYKNSNLEFSLPVWVNSNVQLAPGIGFLIIEDYSDELRFGITGRYFISKSTVSPFLAVSAGIAYNHYKSYYNIGFGGSTPVTNIFYVTGIGFGGEYFINRNFSFGIEIQLNASFADKKPINTGSQGRNSFNTATKAFTAIYF